MAAERPAHVSHDWGLGMKKQLYGTTALVAAGLLAAAPVAQAAEPLSMNVHGYFEQWFGWADNNDPDFEETNFSQDTEIHFDASTTLDNGLKAALHIELEGNQSGDQIDENYFTLSGAFGQILLGSENSAAYKMQYSGDQYVGVPVNSGDTTYWLSTDTLGAGAGLFRTPFGSTYVEVDGSDNDSRRLTYFTPRIQGFQFGASYAPDVEQDGNAPADETAVITNIFSVGANFVQSFNGVDIALAGGYRHGEKPDGNAGSDPEVVSFGVNIGFAGLTVGGSYANAYRALTTAGSGAVPAFLFTTAAGGLTRVAAVAAVAKTNNEAEGFDVGLSYSTGPWTVGATYFHGQREGTTANTDEDEYDAFSAGVSYSLGPGVKLVVSGGHASFEAESGQAAESSNSGPWIVGAFKLSF